MHTACYNKVMEKIFYAERDRYPSTERLMRAVFADHFGIRDARIERSENGKPFLEGTPLFFSVSHTKFFWFAAVSEVNVGIDAESSERETDYRFILSRFPIEEREEIADKEQFLRHWTARESATKWIGGTLADAFSRLSYIKGKLFYRSLELPVRLSHFEIEGHVVALCREKARGETEIIRL